MSTTTESDEVVTYTMPDGRVISNDPRYKDKLDNAAVLANLENLGKATLSMDEIRQALGSANVLPTEFDGSDAARANPPVRVTIAGVEDGAVGDEDDEEDDELGEDGGKYDGLLGKELKAEVDGRNLDRTGLTKKSQLIAVLEADDEAKAADQG